MTQVQAAMVSDHSVTLVIEGQTTPITDSHPNYSEIRKLAASGIYTGIPALLDLVTAIKDFGAGLVTVEDGVVLFEGNPTHNTMTDRILAMVDEGLEVGPMVAFMENVMQNPSFRAVQELYGFLEANDLPITDDGHFLGYKMVNRTADGKFTDIYSGKFDYSVGAPPATMPRNAVNEDKEMTCSSGLHVCAQEYLGQYSSGSCTILVKVNPADVVSVPVDYHNAKMRVCKHETVCEVQPFTRGNVFTSAVFTEKDVERLTAENASLADDDNVMTFADALVHFDCDRSALRKRLNRGVSAKRVYVGGTEMVQVTEPTSDAAPAPVADSTISIEEAMHILGIDRAALRKRLDRGVTVERVITDDEVRVRFLDSED